MNEPESPPPSPTPVYHITDVRNLPGILQRRALLCKRGIDTAGESCISIAHRNIQDRRATRAVLCGTGGTLHDYVPFYFAPRSPMLYAIHKGIVAGHQWGQRAVVHLVSTVQTIDGAGCRYVYTDGHAVMAYTGYFTSLEELRGIDWPLMASRQWANTLEDPDRKRRRQAEFLVYEACPWSLVLEVGVCDAKARDHVTRLLRGAGENTPVAVHPDWYY